MGKGDNPGETKEAWDSNAITPGTPFMDLLAERRTLQFYVSH
jgi:5'-3' exonuclease